jgi:hypothetical protein
MPSKPGQGAQVTINQFDTGSPGSRLAAFFSAMFNTMQNWRDNIQMTAAGYRDRIVHISLRPNEGGLNLAMPPELIRLLTDRGQRAGDLLRDKFDFPSHIWARYRLTMCATQNYLDALSVAWRDPIEQDRLGWDYIAGKEEAPHYRGGQLLEDLLRRALETLVQTCDDWRSGLREGQTFCNGNTPRPEPVLRSQPKF